MNNSSHIFDEHVLCPHAVSVFFTTVLAVISLAAVVGNILVFVAVYKTPGLKTSTNYYYVNMAVSDFLSCLTTWPLYLTDEIITSRGSLIGQGFLATAGCKVGVSMRNVSHSVSFLSLVLIAVDRFIATVYPLKATWLLTKKIRASLLFSIWLISIGLCYPTFHYSRVEKVGQETFCRVALNASATMIYYLFALTMLIASYSAIIILYSRIMRVLRRRLRPQHGTEGTQSNAEHKRTKYNQNVMKIFKSIVVAFVICWSLFCVYLILKIVYPELFVKDKCKLILGFSYFVFPMLSTVTNPVILFSFSSNFRQALKELCPFSLRECKSCWEEDNVSPFQVNEQLLEPLEYQMVERNRRQVKTGNMAVLKL